MSYEFEQQMGYLKPGCWPPRRRVVEVYGTMPEAQEFIREEFNLQHLPPAYALQPPMNPKTQPYRHVTTLQVVPAMGTESSGRSFFEQYRGWLIAAGVIAGGYVIARTLGFFCKRGERIFENPEIKNKRLLRRRGPSRRDYRSELGLAQRKLPGDGQH